MKTYKEMAESVLNSVNEYKIKKNIRNEILKKAVPLCFLCVLLGAGGVFWSAGGYGSLSPAKTEEESKDSSPQDSKSDTQTTTANNTVSISVPDQFGEACWIPDWFENGNMHFKYTYIDKDSTAEELKEIGKNRVYFYMSTAEMEQWENYLDIESLLSSLDIFGESVPTFSTLSERYKAMLEREAGEGEPSFALYRDQVDCYYDNKLFGDISIKEGMILKAHIKGSVPISSDPEPGWENHRWVCTGYSNGAVNYEYITIEGYDHKGQNDAGKAKALAAMTEEEKPRWKDRLDIENIFPDINIYNYISVDRFYKALFEKYPNGGDVNFDFYYRGKKVGAVTNLFFSMDTTLKIYLSGYPQKEQTDGHPDPNDIPDIIKGAKIDGINGNNTAGDIKDRLTALSCENITVYEIELLDPDSKPIYTQHSKVMSDDEDLSRAYGIYIEYDYLGETYALEFFSDDIGSLRFFYK
ncbi:MAG: hypothetical protein K2N36_00440, partial [Ruminiclostridium sp.]|nr:hypothetical protein [Ruminiclostridium sp.]